MLPKTIILCGGEGTLEGHHSLIPRGSALTSMSQMQMRTVDKWKERQLVRLIDTMRSLDEGRVSDADIASCPTHSVFDGAKFHDNSTALNRKKFRNILDRLLAVYSKNNLQCSRRRTVTVSQCVHRTSLKSL